MINSDKGPSDIGFSFNRVAEQKYLWHKVAVAYV